MIKLAQLFTRILNLGPPEDILVKPQNVKMLSVNKASADSSEQIQLNYEFLRRFVDVDEYMQIKAYIN